MRGCGQGVSPEEQPLRAWPNSMDHSPLAIFTTQVPIAVPQKAARAGTEFHQACGSPSRARLFNLSNVRLMVRHAHVLSPVFGRDLPRQPGCDCQIQHGFVHALGVHVDLDFAAARGHAIKNAFPEIVTTFFHAALSVNAESYAADGGTCFQKGADGVAAIWPMGLARESFSRVIRFRAIDPFVAMHPET